MALISTVSAFVWLILKVIAKKLMIRATTLLSSIKFFFFQLHDWVVYTKLMVSARFSPCTFIGSPCNIVHLRRLIGIFYTGNVYAEDIPIIIVFFFNVDWCTFVHYINVWKLSCLTRREQQRRKFVFFLHILDRLVSEMFFFFFFYNLNLLFIIQFTKFPVHAQ